MNAGNSNCLKVKCPTNSAEKGTENNSTLSLVTKVLLALDQGRFLLSRKSAEMANEG